MNKSKIILSVILTVLLTACAFSCLYTFTLSFDFEFPRVLAGISFAAILSALYYSYRGYTKKVAPLYKAYMIITATYFLGLTIDTALNIEKYCIVDKTVLAFLIFGNALAFGLMLLIGFGKDIGETITNIIGIVCILLAFAPVLVMILKSTDVSDSIMFMLYNKLITGTTLATVAHVMVQFKYIDKAERKQNE